jgi:hypothetical protein
VGLGGVELRIPRRFKKPWRSDAELRNTRTRGKPMEVYRKSSDGRDRSNIGLTDGISRSYSISSEISGKPNRSLSGFGSVHQRANRLVDLPELPLGFQIERNERAFELGEFARQVLV